ncbi:hypothetical protein ACLOJK_008478 [Asimina triloba]
MSSMSSPAAPNPCRSRLPFQKNAFRPSPPPLRIPAFFATVSAIKSAASIEIYGSQIRRSGCKLRQSSLRISATDGDPVDFSSFDEDEGDNVISDEDILSLSDGEENDAGLLVIPSTDAEFPHRHDLGNSPIFNSSGKTQKAQVLQIGDIIKESKALLPMLMICGCVASCGASSSSGISIRWKDWQSSSVFAALTCYISGKASIQIVRLPLRSFFLMRPFAISAILASFAGFLYVPIVDTLKIHQIIRKEGPARHALKNRTPTMGGLFFIPIGITVARAIAGFSSVGVCGAATATLAFAVIGLLDDILSSVKYHNYGLSPLFKFGLLAAVVNLTDGLDGLAGGTAALAFVGMSIAVLPICSGQYEPFNTRRDYEWQYIDVSTTNDSEQNVSAYLSLCPEAELAVFGASMAGACVGFLSHNGYKASIFMGDTGSLALGGALAAMAACTGMFFPLLIASGIFIIEVLSVIIQVSFFKATRRLYGVGRRLFRMAPLHHHLELCGMAEPRIVISAYIVSSILALLSGYVGLISA